MRSIVDHGVFLFSASQGYDVSTVFLPNLFFEEELNSGTLATHGHLHSAAARRLVAELAPLLGLLAALNEVSFVLVRQGEMPGQIPASLSHVNFVSREQWMACPPPAASSMTFVPWGWSSEAQRVGTAMGLVVSSPDVSVVEFVNSRRFLVPLDHVVDRNADVGSDGSLWDGGTFSRLCRTSQEVDEGLSELSMKPVPAWVMKSDLSHAARNRILGRGIVLSETHRRWLANQLRDQHAVALEPWVERISECGMQFTISPPGGAGEIRFDGVAEMLTDSSGRYSGSWISRETGSDWFDPAIAYGFELAHRIQQCGYFGPVGFDCMMFRDPHDGRERIRLCHDINARLTMGRIALSLRRFLGENEIGLWLHATAERWDMAADEPISRRGDSIHVNASTGSSVRIIPTSPSMTGSKPTQLKTALLISSDRAALRSVAGRIL